MKPKKKDLFSMLHGDGDDYSGDSGDNGDDDMDDKYEYSDSFGTDT